MSVGRNSGPLVMTETEDKTITLEHLLSPPLNTTLPHFPLMLSAIIHVFAPPWFGFGFESPCWLGPVFFLFPLNLLASILSSWQLVDSLLPAHIVRLPASPNLLPYWSKSHSGSRLGDISQPNPPQALPSHQESFSSSELCDIAIHELSEWCLFPSFEVVRSATATSIRSCTFEL